MMLIRSLPTRFDDFNRANENLTTPWTQVNNPRVNSNRCEATGTVPFSGTTTCWAVHQDPLALDIQEVTSAVISPVGTQAGTQFSSIVLRSTSAATTGTKVAFEFSSSSGNAIASYSGTTRTSQATNGTNIATGDIVRFTAVGNVYTGYVNGTQRVQWTDTGNVVTIGASNRHFGLIVRVQGTFGSGSWSFALNDITATG